MRNLAHLRSTGGIPQHILHNARMTVWGDLVMALLSDDVERDRRTWWSHLCRKADVSSYYKVADIVLVLLASRLTPNQPSLRPGCSSQLRQPSPPRQCPHDPSRILFLSHAR